MSTRTGQEIVLAIISIAGGIAMACKAMAEISKKVQPHAPLFLFEQIGFLSFVQSLIFDDQMLKASQKNVVAVAHNLKVVVAGAQMTSSVVQKEE